MSVLKQLPDVVSCGSAMRLCRLGVHACPQSTPWALSLYIVV